MLKLDLLNRWSESVHPSWNSVQEPADAEADIVFPEMEMPDPAVSISCFPSMLAWTSAMTSSCSAFFAFTASISLSRVAVRVAVVYETL